MSFILTGLACAVVGFAAGWLLKTDHNVKSVSKALDTAAETAKSAVGKE